MANATVSGRIRWKHRPGFHELVATEPVPLDEQSVTAVLDDFLAWCYENRAKRTADRYEDFCQSFVDRCGRLSVSELLPGHVTTWLNKNKQWNSTTKRNAVTAIQRGFNWAVRNTGIKYNPIRGMEKPAAQSWTDTISPLEYRELIGYVRDHEFRDLLEFCWETSSRPQESKRLEARHLDLEKSRCVIPYMEAKKQRTRVIYLTDKAREIVTRLAGEHPTGPLFRNRRGRPWTAYSVKCRFARLEEKIGRRIRQYMFRHTWITRKLTAGVDSHMVAKLAGHSDTKMLDKVYSDVADDYELMLRMATKDVDA